MASEDAEAVMSFCKDLNGSEILGNPNIAIGGQGM